jgi:hypothetical protein
VIINKHGGKIATTRDLAMGAEVLVENHSVGMKAKGSVVWLGEKPRPGELHHVGLQLLEAQNIWGIIFPPDDWVGEESEEALAAMRPAPASGKATPLSAAPVKAPSTGEQVSNRVAQELREAADACARDFQDRLKQLTQQLGMELEFDLRARAFIARDREVGVGGMGEQIRILQESLNITKEEVGKLETRVRQMKADLQTPPKSTHTTPAKEAQRQFTALSNSMLEDMRRAVEEGLREYRSLLQKENQESASKLGTGTGMNPPTPPGRQQKH